MVDIHNQMLGDLQGLNRQLALTSGSMAHAPIGAATADHHNVIGKHMKMPLTKIRHAKTRTVRLSIDDARTSWEPHQSESHM